MAEEQAEKVHRYKRTYGAFERTFRLSASIDPNEIKAGYNLGVLTITLPKAETARPHLIKVEVAPEGVEGVERLTSRGGGGRYGCWLFALLLVPGGYMLMLTEHTDSMEGLLTHVATADCFLTLPHSALACGIVTAWWRFQVEGDTLMPRQHAGEQGLGQQRGRVSRQRTHPIKD